MSLFDDVMLIISVNVFLNNLCDNNKNNYKIMGYLMLKNA